MIIIPSKKTLFIHLHKCGGESVERAYEKVSRYDDLILGGTELGPILNPYYKKRFGLHKHSTVDQIIEAIGAETYAQMDVFCLVRNPFRVYESFYGYIARTFDITASNRGLSLKKIKKIVDTGKPGLPFSRWPVAQAFARTNNFEEFVDYFYRRKRPIEPSIFKQLRLENDMLRPKHIYKLENFDEFWPAFSRAVGAELEPEHANRSFHSNYAWKKEHISYVHVHHGKEIEYFGYQFEDH